jgi:tetratricopeptide (TPR) repeat protein
VRSSPPEARAASPFPTPSRLAIPVRALLVVLMLCAGVPSRADELADVQRLVAAGEAERALQVARAAKAPRAPALQFAEGVILMDLKRDVEAAAVFDALAQRHPELPEPHNNLALLHARAGRLDAARAALETALRNEPSNQLARMNLGEIHLRLAIQAWERAALGRPDDAALKRRLEQARELAAASR